MCRSLGLMWWGRERDVEGEGIWTRGAREYEVPDSDVVRDVRRGKEGGAASIGPFPVPLTSKMGWGRAGSGREGGEREAREVAVGCVSSEGVQSLVSDAVGVSSVLRTVATGATPALAGAGIVAAQKLAEVAHPGGLAGAAGEIMGELADLSVGIAARAAPLAASLAASASVFAGSLYVSQVMFVQARLSCALPGIAPVLGASAVAVGSALAGQAGGCLATLRGDGLGTPEMDLATAGGRRRLFASFRSHAASVQADALLLDAVVGMALFRVLGGRFSSVLPSDVRFPGGAAFKAGSLPASGRNYAGDGARAEIHALGRRFGCHSCGSRMSRRYNADHQPPNKYAKLREQRGWATLWMKPKPVVQRFYPQCHSCSNLQGGAVHSDTAVLVMHRQLPLQPWHWVPGAAVAALSAPPALSAMISDEERQAREENRRREAVWGAGGEALRRQRVSVGSDQAAGWGAHPKTHSALAEEEAAWALLGGRAKGAFMAAESLAASVIVHGLGTHAPSSPVPAPAPPRRRWWNPFGGRRRVGAEAKREPSAALGPPAWPPVAEVVSHGGDGGDHTARRGGRSAWQAARSASRLPARHGSLL